jgi:hypothetical protein
MKNDIFSSLFDTFLYGNFFETFLSDSKSVSNSEFFYTHINLVQQKVSIVLVVSENFEAWCALNGTTKWISFLECAFECNFASIYESEFFIFSQNKIKSIVPY